MPKNATQTLGQIQDKKDMPNCLYLIWKGDIEGDNVSDKQTITRKTFPPQSYCKMTKTTRHSSEESTRKGVNQRSKDFSSAD